MSALQVGLREVTENVINPLELALLTEIQASMFILLITPLLFPALTCQDVFRETIHYHKNAS